MKDSARDDLFDYCRQNCDNIVIERCLKKHDNLDLLYKKGIFFKFAIGNDNINMLNALLQYYKDQNFKDDFEDYEHKITKYKLKLVLQDAVDTYHVSDEIQKILDRYLKCDEDTDTDQALSDFDDIDDPIPPTKYEKNDGSSSTLTRANLDIHDSQQQGQLSIDLLLGKAGLGDSVIHE